MKFSKIFFFFAFFLTIKLLAPCSCDVDRVENPRENDVGLMKLEEDLERKKKNEKMILISSVATGIAVLLGSALGLGYYAQKNKSTGKPKSEKQGEEKSESSEESSESSEESGDKS
ncbi:early transcribed membrane protein [Plasmodium gallinaceum]|uniref:Early transcribed membrane protein n=1 Tax=Plasmodium gallinaceum TaxID=5849 RepID=A0A1J1H3A0_PLAGA|nr:early transcribed membrane protein [Plasmodium gallinaceum]CRG97965.1 early transcribed membrane protein [Plasmodium gallinaceum]